MGIIKEALLTVLFALLFSSNAVYAASLNQLEIADRTCSINERKTLTDDIQGGVEIVSTEDSVAQKQIDQAICHVPECYFENFTKSGGTVELVTKKEISEIAGNNCYDGIYVADKNSVVCIPSADMLVHEISHFTFRSTSDFMTRELWDEYTGIMKTWEDYGLWDSVKGVYKPGEEISEVFAYASQDYYIRMVPDIRRDPGCIKTEAWQKKHWDTLFPQYESFFSKFEGLVRGNMTE